MHELLYRSIDLAGNVEIAGICQINIDQTAPVIEAITPMTPADAFGYYYGDSSLIGFIVTVNDPWSGVDPARTDYTKYLPSGLAGIGLTTTVSVTDLAGNVAIQQTPSVNIQEPSPISPGNNENLLIWSEPTSLDGTLSGYNVYRSTTTTVPLVVESLKVMSSMKSSETQTMSFGEQQLSNIIGSDGREYVLLAFTSETQYLDSNLENGVTYYYLIVPVTAEFGESNVQLELSGTPSGEYNARPVASFSATSTMGNSQTLFGLDASASSDLEDGLGVLVRWDWDGDSTWDTDWTTAKTGTHQYASPGLYEVILEVKDSQGLIARTSQSVMVENDSPAIDIDTSGTLGANGWYVSTVTINAAASDTGSGVASFQFRINSGSWGDYNGAIVLSTDGIYTITFRAIDHAGNIATNSISISRDATAPTAVVTPIGSISAYGWYKADVTMQFVLSDDWSGVSGDSTRNIVINTNGAGQTVSILVTDMAGNTATIVSPAVNIDKIAPSLSGAPTTAPNGNGWYNGDVTVHFTASDALSGLVPYSADVIVTGEGTNLFATLTVTDKAGNSASYTVSGIKIDRTAPATSITIDGTSYPAGSSVSVPINAQIALSASDALSTVASIQYAYDSTSSWTTYSGAFSPLVGQHTLYYRAVDKAGNIETIRSIIITGIAPTGTISSVAYTGDSVIMLSSGSINLRATLIGDLADWSSVQVTFKIYKGTVAGTPLKTLTATCSLTPENGVAVATANVPIDASLTEGEYIMVTSYSFAGGSGQANLAIVTLVSPSGDFITGGGWIWDSTGQKGSFGFVVRYDKGGKPSGSFTFNE
jgi:hypothetical protein